MSDRLFEKIARNITDTEKMIMTNIIGNFVADNIVFEVSKIGPVDPDNIVFGSGVLARHPEELF